MATVNFSVPDDVKRAFDETFAGKNKSAILSRLMREAVEEVEVRERRTAAARRIIEGRASAATVPSDELDEARRAGRP